MQKKIGNYNSDQKILLVGEGNFSFAASLAKAFVSATNMVATCLHSKDVLLTMHPSSMEHLKEVEERGCEVFYEVDVATMNTHPKLKYKTFDVILFNFPHAGHFGIHETETWMIRKHQELMRAYFRSSKQMIGWWWGEIHVNHRDDNPYNKWEMEELAQEFGLVLKDKVEFNQWLYSGYTNKRGSTSRCDDDFPLNQCFTFKFILP